MLPAFRDLQCFLYCTKRCRVLLHKHGAIELNFLKKGGKTKAFATTQNAKNLVNSVKPSFSTIKLPPQSIKFCHIVPQGISLSSKNKISRHDGDLLAVPDGSLPIYTTQQYRGDDIATFFQKSKNDGRHIHRFCCS